MYIQCYDIYKVTLSLKLDEYTSPSFSFHNHNNNNSHSSRLSGLQKIRRQLPLPPSPSNLFCSPLVTRGSAIHTHTHIYPHLLPQHQSLPMAVVEIASFSFSTQSSHHDAEFSQAQPKFSAFHKIYVLYDCFVTNNAKTNFYNNISVRTLTSSIICSRRTRKIKQIVLRNQVSGSERKTDCYEFARPPPPPIQDETITYYRACTYVQLFFRSIQPITRSNHEKYHYVNDVEKRVDDQ